MKQQKAFDVLIAGYYGFGNLGDELLLEACLFYLQKNGVPKERIAVLSSAPQETARRYGVRAFDRWKFSLLGAAMRQSNSLLLGGGGLFQDATSVRSYLYYWWLVKLARIEKVKVWAIGQSIGPLTTFFGRFFTKNALRQCALVGVRDERSQKLLAQWQVDAFRTPDLVLGLELSPASRKENVLLLNLRPWPGSLGRDAAYLAQQTAKKRGLRIRGVALSAEDAVVLEVLCAEKIVDLHEIVLLKSAEDFEKHCTSAACAVGMRLHFLVLSLLAGIPLCAVPYNPKVESLRMEYNIPVTDESADELAFSGPLPGESAEKCAVVIEQAFARALEAAPGE